MVESGIFFNSTAYFLLGSWWPKMRFMNLEKSSFYLRFINCIKKPSWSGYVFRYLNNFVFHLTTFHCHFSLEVKNNLWKKPYVDTLCRKLKMLSLIVCIFIIILSVNIIGNFIGKRHTIVISLLLIFTHLIWR